MSYPDYGSFIKNRMSRALASAFFPSLSTALLLGSPEDGEGVGEVFKGPELSCRKRKAKEECVFLPAF